jgi:hypothetical protein
MNAKARRPAAKRRVFAGFSRKLRAAFDANGERRVSGKSPVWFRNGGCGKRMPHFWHRRGTNRDFSADRNSRIFGEIWKN